MSEYNEMTQAVDGDDYTFDATVTDWRKRAGELERENAELRARLDAVPVTAIRKITFDDKRSFGVIRAEMTVAGWLATFDMQAVQP